MAVNKESRISPTGRPTRLERRVSQFHDGDTLRTALLYLTPYHGTMPSGFTAPKKNPRLGVLQASSCVCVSLRIEGTQVRFPRLYELNSTAHLLAMPLLEDGYLETTGVPRT